MQTGLRLKKNKIKKILHNKNLNRILAGVFIGYGLKTGQGFYPGPFFYIYLKRNFFKFKALCCKIF